MFNELKSFVWLLGFRPRRCVRRTIAEMITPHADGVWTDNLGNLIALKKGTAKEKRR